MSIGRNPSVPSISINVAEERVPPPFSLSIPVQVVRQTSESPRSLLCSPSVEDINVISALVGIATGCATGLALTGFALNNATVTISSCVTALSASGSSNLVLRWLNRHSISSRQQEQEQEDYIQFSTQTLERIPPPIDIPSLPSRLPSYEEALSQPVVDQPQSVPPSYNEATIQANQEEQENPPSPPST